MKEAHTVITLEPGEASRAADVMTEAFHRYPVTRYVLRDAGDRYDAHLRRLVGFFVMARVLRHEPMFGIELDGRLAATAILSYPENRESPSELAELRESVWGELGAAARERYEACGTAWAPLQVTEPHVHLNMLGVRAAARGRGLARVLLEHVQDLSRATPGSGGVSLTTEDPKNVPMYEHVGYEVVGHVSIAPELETWSMFRRG